MEWIQEVLSKFEIEQFQSDLLHWYEKNKRDLPWRKENDPYKIWVSEIMLQQTKVDTVIPYFERFMEQFPTVEDLARAEEEVVLKAWEGLGYYSRARNLQHAVQEVHEKYNGKVPSTIEELKSLKGVGPYTAGAILSIAFNIPAAAVDGNVMRVFSRIFFITDDISLTRTRKKFEFVVDQVISKQFPGAFNQALMDLGARICTPRSPACSACPVWKQCLARDRELQEELPVKKKSKAPVEKKMKAVVLFNEKGEVLIEKRPSQGLLSNLWQFPNIEAKGKGSGEMDGYDELMLVRERPTFFNEKSDFDGANNVSHVSIVRGVDQVEELEEYLWKTGSLRVEIKPNVIQQVRHIFSHIIWDIDVYEGVVLQVENEAKFCESAFQFVSIDEVNTYPFPVSHQKIYHGSVRKEEKLD